jgi:hypothetical protein
MRTIGLLVALIVASVGVCLAQPASTVDKPEIKAGERWIYHRMDYRRNALIETYEVRVSFVGAGVIHGVVRKHRVVGKPEDVRVGGTPTLAGDKEGETDAVWTSEWNSVNTADGAVMKPHSGLFRFPLKVGTKYPAAYEFRRPREGSRAARVEHTVRVVGWEEVSVPAGTFRALRIEAAGTFQRLDVAVRGPERRVCWYVPEIKRSVKCTYEESHTSRGEELVAFELR